MFKILAVGVFAILAVSSTSSTYIKPRNIELELAVLIRNFKQFLIFHEKESTIIIENALTSLKTEASKIYWKNLNDVKKTFEETKSELLNIQNFGDDLGLDTKLCLENKLTTLEAKSSAAVDATKSCLDKKIYLAFTFKQDYIKEHDFFVNALQGQESVSSTCVDHLCFETVYMEIENLLQEAQDRLDQVRTDAVRSIADIFKTASACIDFEFEKYAAALIDEVTKCVYDLMGFKAGIFQTRGLEEVIAIIEKLKNIVKNAIENAIQKISDFVEGFKNLAQAIIKDAQEKLIHLVGDILSKIDKLVQDASQLGVDVSDCVGGHKEEIEQLAKDTIANGAACIEQNIEDVKQVMVVIKNEVNEVYGTVERLEHEFLACDNAICYGKVLLEANGLLVSLPIRIGKVVLKANDIVIKAQVKATACMVDGIKKFNAQTAPIVSGITKCIAEKIKEHNNQMMMY